MVSRGELGDAGPRGFDDTGSVGQRNASVVGRNEAGTDGIV